MDMIETIARAICRRNYPGSSGTDIDEMWDGWKEDATAAIKAMREPTPAMIDRFVSHRPASPTRPKRPFMPSLQTGDPISAYQRIFLWDQD